MAESAAQKRRVMIGTIGVQRHWLSPTGILSGLVAFEKAHLHPSRRSQHQASIQDRPRHPIRYSSPDRWWASSDGQRRRQDNTRPTTIALGNQSASLPRQDRKNLIRRNRRPRPRRKTAVDVKRTDIRVEVAPQFSQAPQFAPIDRHEIAPMTACVDQAKKSCPSFVMTTTASSGDLKKILTLKLNIPSPAYSMPSVLAGEPVETIATDKIAAP